MNSLLKSDQLALNLLNSFHCHMITYFGKKDNVPTYKVDQRKWFFKKFLEM